MKAENNDEQLIKQLKQLPKVEDHRDKDELFRHISSKISENKPRKKYKLVSVFGTLIVVMLIFAIVPLMINLSMSETSVNDSAGNAFNETSNSNHDAEVAIEESSIEQEKRAFNSQVESYVLRSIDENSTIIYSAVSDYQLQTIIPVTIVVPGTVDLNTHYNQLNDYMDEANWGVNQYLFKNANFDLNLSKHEVSMEISDDFSLLDSSENLNVFTEILTIMFIPYQIEKVVFEEEIDLGSTGIYKEFALPQKQGEAYKVFQADEHQRKFLVPSKIEGNILIEEAFEEMKNGRKDLNIFPTIPEEVQFSIASSDNELLITTNHEEIFEDEQRTVIMIEAILMTAKSFGYEFVTFNGISNEQVGPYQLSKSIQVPEAINPIYQ